MFLPFFFSSEILHVDLPFRGRRKREIFNPDYRRGGRLLNSIQLSAKQRAHINTNDITLSEIEMHEASSPALIKLLKFNASLAEKYGAIPADIRHPTLGEYFITCELQKANREAWKFVRSMSDS